MWHLNEYARPIASIGLTTARAAVVEVVQHLDGLLQDAMGFPALHVDHEANATGLVLIRRIVKALLDRRPQGAACLALRSATLLLHVRFS